MGSAPGAAGALYSTVEDMFLWDRALYTDQLLEKKYLDLMFTPNRDVPEVKAAGGRPQSNYGYGWQIYSRSHPVTKRRTKIINHGGAINGFRAMENRLVDDDAFVIILCNQGDMMGSTEVWNSVTRLSSELIHIVTEQPYRMPGKPRITQQQRMYQLAKNEGVEAAVEWFKSKGKPAGWGGANTTVAARLMQDGLTDAAVRLMEFDLEMTPGKVWLIRKTAQMCLNNGRPNKAIIYANKGLEIKPEDESLKNIKSEAEQDLKK